MRADLHMHTINSDGGLEPIEVAKLARSRNLDYIAFTDHDTYTSPANIRIDGLTIINGIEMSSCINKESIHILAYFNGEPPKAFLDYLDDIKKSRIERANKIIDLLKENFDINLDKGFLNKQNCITRGEISREIIRQGYNYTPKYIFDNLIGNGCPCYIPANEATPKDIVKLIKDNNGLCVLAHPMLYKKENLNQIIDLGFDGIEAKYPRFNAHFSKYRDIARKRGMFITAGSDFHTISEMGEVGNKHGICGDVYIEGHDLDVFIQKLNERGN